MKIISWNVRRATEIRNDVWGYFHKLLPDLALLQEVNSLPDFIKNDYSILQRKAYAGDGKNQKFSTALLVRGSIDNEIKLSSTYDWINEELQNFAGNIIAAEVTLHTGEKLNAISVYSPAWPIFDKKFIKEKDVEGIQLKNNPDIWLTEIIWASLLNKNITLTPQNPWIVAGDFNSSVTFDTLWKGGPRGNQQFQDRMEELGFVECLRFSQGKLTPTFRNPSNKQVIHQMDHLFVSNKLDSKLLFCTTGNSNLIFNESLSDHLPILAEFTDKPFF